MLNANFIDPLTFAAAGYVHTWTFALFELDERVAAHEYFAEDAALDVTLAGGMDGRRRLFIDVRLRASLLLVCQRCLKPMPWVLDETVRVLLFRDDAVADAADAEGDADVLVVGEDADVREWVEDQLLMALPVAPHHQDCGEDAPDARDTDLSNPFAVLRRIAR